MTHPAHAGNRVTRADVAADAGVSTAVVSYVVNQGPKNVSDITRLRVEESIRRLGYRPNPVARALKMGRTATYGLLLPDIVTAYFAELAEAVVEEAFRQKHALILASSGNDPERERTQFEALCNRQVDGLIVASTDPETRFLDSFDAGVPVVLIDRTSSKPGVASVGIDNRQGAHLATDHLVTAHGHSHILFLSGPEGLPFVAEREAGWREALQGAERPVHGVVARSGFSKRDARRVALTELARNPRPTAVFALSGVQAVGVLRACWDLGLSVPDDVAIISFDGTLESEFTTPPLSVVQHQLAETAKSALELLSRPRAAHAATSRIMPFELVLRDSCGPHGSSTPGAD